MCEMVDDCPDEGSGQDYHRQHGEPGNQPRDEPVLDKSGCARIWIGRNASSYQARQTGLNDAEDKMAVTARNAKVHRNHFHLRFRKRRCVAL